MPPCTPPSSMPSGRRASSGRRPRHCSCSTTLSSESSLSFAQCHRADADMPTAMRSLMSYQSCAGAVALPGFWRLPRRARSKWICRRSPLAQRSSPCTGAARATVKELPACERSGHLAHCSEGAEPQAARKQRHTMLGTLAPRALTSTMQIDTAHVAAQVGDGPARLAAAG